MFLKGWWTCRIHIPRSFEYKVHACRQLGPNKLYCILRKWCYTRTSNGAEQDLSCMHVQREWKRSRRERQRELCLRNCKSCILLLPLLPLWLCLDSDGWTSSSCESVWHDWDGQYCTRVCMVEIFTKVHREMCNVQFTVTQYLCVNVPQTI